MHIATDTNGIIKKARKVSLRAKDVFAGIVERRARGQLFIRTHRFPAFNLGTRNILGDEY